MTSHDPLREAFEIREQLASAERRLAFFLGAGTSMAMGVPGIAKLTEKVSEELPASCKAQFANVMAELSSASPNVENVLDHIRICRELFGDSEDKQYGCLKGAVGTRELDLRVCQAIRRVVSVDLEQEPKPHMILAQWLQQLRTRRDWPVEVFTTNYDLLLEQAMEKCSVPFFDGFVGSVASFFAPESVEAEPAKHSEAFYPPRAWTRLWKLHGSINWYVSETTGNRARIVRVSDSGVEAGKELVIFPSREKYAQSRKLPFLAFQDRLRRFVASGSCLVIILGYSFSDEHLNEIIFQGLRSNPDLAVTAFRHSNLTPDLIEQGRENRNLTIYGSDKACVGGIVAPWTEPSKTPKESEPWPFWDGASKRFTLGDFNNFASFLELFIGLRSPTQASTAGPPTDQVNGSVKEVHES